MPADRCPSKELALETAEPLPAWARKPAPLEPDPPTPLAPSQPLPDEALASPRAFSPLTPGDPRRWKRGQLLHELLRHLPAVPWAERREAARRFLAQPAHGLGDEEIELERCGPGRAEAQARRPVRRELARRGSLTARCGREGIRHRQWPGRSPSCVRARGADRRLQDQPAAAGSRHASGAGLPPPARALPGVAGRDLSGPYRPGVSPVDGCAVVDGNRCENP